jgi:hypothetical protein
VELREVFPNELQHQQLIKIGVEQRSRDRVELPVVVMRPLSEIDDHRATFFQKS